MSLITVTAPGDLLGTLTAGLNAVSNIMIAVTAIANDQSPEGRAAAKAMIELLAPLNFIIQKLNGRLGIDPVQENK